jgi:transaldolase/glucose-6-phosphate isomerase
LPLSQQEIHPRSLERAYQREISSFIADRAIARLWAKDLTLWPEPAASKKMDIGNLNWLDLPQQMHEYMLRVMARADALEKQGFETLVFVGMGASNLAADTIQRVSAAKRWRRFFVQDSIDPDSIAKLDSTLDLPATLFVFATKSGKLIETHALLLHFLGRLRELGIAQPGRHFIAVTEKGSYLSKIATEYRFHDAFFDPPGIGGRFSSLIHFDLLLSAIGRSDPGLLSASGIAMQKSCGAGSAPQDNPALTLAALLSAGAREGLDRLFLVSPPSLASVTRSLADLIGSSTGKDRRGIVPILGEIPWERERPCHGCLVATLSLRGEMDDQVKKLAGIFVEKNMPTVSIQMDEPEALGAELFKWQLATVLACSRLGVNPFDQPDAQRSRQAAQRRLQDIVTRSEFSLPTIRISDSGVDLRAETSTRQEISTRNLPEAFRTFLELRRPDGYLAVMSFLEETPEVAELLLALRTQLESHIGIPVQLSFGPRYLHSLGQVYKGGPAKGLFVILTAQPERDIPVPGAGYTFGQLQTVLAAGDFEVLYQRNDQVLWLHLTGGAAQGLSQLQVAFGPALAHLRQTAQTT